MIALGVLVAISVVGIVILCVVYRKYRDKTLFEGESALSSDGEGMEMADHIESDLEVEDPDMDDPQPDNDNKEDDNDDNDQENEKDRDDKPLGGEEAAKVSSGMVKGGEWAKIEEAT